MEKNINALMPDGAGSSAKDLQLVRHDILYLPATTGKKGYKFAAIRS